MFAAEITDFRTVSNILKAISFKEYVIVRPTPEGLKFTLEEMRSVETSVYIPCAFFTSYRINAVNGKGFKICIKILTECFSIFGEEARCTMKLSYKGHGDPLSLVLSHPEENITIDCEIKTLNVEDVPDISLSVECNSSKIVLMAEIFVELLTRLDNWADDLVIEISNEYPYLTLTASSIGGESKVHISKTSDCVNIYECKEKTSATYSFSHIRQILKVMAFANSVSILTGETGLLGLQLAIPSEDKQMFVEHYVTSQFLN